MKIRAIALFVLFSAALSAQDFNNYRPLKSAGKLPGEFIKTTNTKVQEDLDAAVKKGETTTPAKKQFLVESHYVLNQLLQSGKILTGDPVTEYVNKVVDTLLRNDPGLRSQLHVYVIKSPYVNAYTLDDGYVLVNLGLIAQLENEAQLAFILSHEIIHYRNKHSLNTYLEYLKIDRSSGQSYNDQIEAKLEYSKDQETEADVEGFSVFARSNYSLDAVMSAFDVMQYSYLPFDEVPFEVASLEDDNMRLPESALLKETKAISNEDNFDDSKSTHPNIRKRKQALRSQVENTFNDPAKKKYLVSEEEFKRVQTISRFEMCRLYLLNREYPDAIYSSYLLQKKYPESKFLKSVTGKALYNIAAYRSVIKNNSEQAKIFWESRLGEDYSNRWRVPDYEDIEGSSQQVYHILKTLDSDETAVLALHYNWKLHKQFPNDRTLSRMCDSLMMMLSYKHKLLPDDFSRKTKAEVLHEKALRDSVNKLAQKKEDDGGGSKYDKIKKQQEENIVSDKNEKFTYFAFADFLKDENFRNRYEKLTDVGKKREEAEKNTMYNKLELPKALGIDKVVVVEPFVLRIDDRKRGASKMKYLESETAQQEMLAELAKMSQSGSIRASFIDPQLLDTNTIMDYNDMSTMKEWITERMKQGNASTPFIIANDSLEELSQKYGTKYFMWSGVVSVQKKKKLAWPVIFIGGGVFVLANESLDATAGGAAAIGLGALLLLRPSHQTLHYTMLFNIENGDILYSTYDQFSGRDSKTKMRGKYGKVFSVLKKKN
ncbi:MAG: Peptidase family M48 [Bacteroidetes bacterium]|nr:MAG: Peptidase family M48 [Bacteroidota bacterium]